MVYKLLCIAFLVTIACAQPPDAQQFEENLKKLDALIQNYESRDQARSNQAAQRKHHHHRQNPSLYNVQNLNVVLKRNRHRNAAQKALRTLEKSVALETEQRICEQTGRCGCSRGRCGNNREQNSLEQLLNNMEQQLGNSRHQDRSHQQHNDRSDDHENPLQKVSLGDNVDVVVLDLPTLKKLLRDPASVGTTRQQRNSLLPRTKQQLSRILAQQIAKNQQNTRRHLENSGGRRNAVAYRMSGQALAQAN